MLTSWPNVLFSLIVKSGHGPFSGTGLKHRLDLHFFWDRGDRLALKCKPVICKHGLNT